jgi:CHASE2 domain-containing sensor protein
MQHVKEAVVITMIWVVAAVSPGMLADREHRPGLVFWAALAIGWGVLAYDAVGAWREGRRTPALLRIVIPGGLLFASVVALRAGAWDGVLSQLRVAG